MKISRTKFVILFILSGFAFVFAYNVIILSVMRGRPDNAAVFLETGSLTGWKAVVSTILYPVKLILVGPMWFMLNLPDPPPPFVGIAFALYWAVLALVIYYIIGRVRLSKAGHHHN